MLIGQRSKYLLKKTQAKSRMFEYDVSLEDHIQVEDSAIKLLLIAIGCIGETSKEILLSEDVGQLNLNRELKSEIHFSAVFFDSLITSRIDNNIWYTQYYYLLGSVSYYFCDYIGSSKVMLSFINNEIDVDGGGFEKAIYLILDDSNIQNEEIVTDGFYAKKINETMKEYFDYFETGNLPNFKANQSFVKQVLQQGTNREAFLCEILIALIKKKVLDSALNLLPLYSDITAEKWENEILSSKKLRELWPAQKKLGEIGLFSGKSGVVQMPTSSGKTTGIAINIHSRFLSEPGKNAIVIAPFRALCKEISRDLKEYFSEDYNIKVEEIFDIPNKAEIGIFAQEDKNLVFVLTPEKLLFLLRNDETILDDVITIIFDEAHLFDDSTRGTGYELLISTVKHYLPDSAQTVLISAVVPNAKVINNWINGESGVVVSDNTIKSAEKSIAIGDWIDGKSRLTFINPENPDQELYYVPRVVEITKLKRLKGERKDRNFPDVNVGSKQYATNDLSIYYSLKLLHNGAIAIFCGQKASIPVIIQRILEIETRGEDVSVFKNACRNNESKKIAKLFEVNFGQDSIYVKGAEKGVFPHHADIPLGAKYAVEFAMTKKLIGLVVCTSTLAQGINLPIKYLIVSNVFQAGEKISVRDFHNLIGRTGRAGKHTEGSVILTEPFVYSLRKFDSYKWNRYSNLIDTNNCEPCDSTILQLVQTLQLKLKGSHTPLNLRFYAVILDKYKNIEKYNNAIKATKDLFHKNYPDGIRLLEKNIIRMESSLRELESYILSNLTRGDIANELLSEEIAKETLGYFLANDDEKQKIIELFQTIYHYILSIPEESRKLLAQTSMGVFAGNDLLKWTKSEADTLLNINDEGGLIDLIIPKVNETIQRAIIKNLVDKDNLKDICKIWIEGFSYSEITEICNQKNVKVIRRGKEKDIKLEEIVQICDKVFAYENLLPINAVKRYLSENEMFNTEDLFNNFSKKMKYGLPSLQAVMVYELGFSDRCIAQNIALKLPPQVQSKSLIKRFLRRNKEGFQQLIEEFPSYFSDTLSKI